MKHCDGCDHKEESVSYELPRKLLTSNTTVWAHIFVARKGYALSKKLAKASGQQYSSSAISYKRITLVKYGPLKESQGLRNLLTGERPAWELALENVPGIE
jgi:hypothetical protein